MISEWTIDQFIIYLNYKDNKAFKLVEEKTHFRDLFIPAKEWQAMGGANNSKQR